MLMLFWMISFFIRIDSPPEALRPVSIMQSYCSNVFMFSLSLCFLKVSWRHIHLGKSGQHIQYTHTEERDQQFGISRLSFPSLLLT